jgi:ribosomal protein S18
MKKRKTLKESEKIESNFITAVKSTNERKVYKDIKTSKCVSY